DDGPCRLGGRRARRGGHGGPRERRPRRGPGGARGGRDGGPRRARGPQGRRQGPDEGGAVSPGEAPAATKTLARMRGITKAYRRGGEDLVLLDGLDLGVASGEFLALMGPSGSGKSTIVN